MHHVIEPALQMADPAKQRSFSACITIVCIDFQQISTIQMSLTMWLIRSGLMVKLTPVDQCLFCSARVCSWLGWRAIHPGGPITSVDIFKLRNVFSPIGRSDRLLLAEPFDGCERMTSWITWPDVTLFALYVVFPRWRLRRRRPNTRSLGFVLVWAGLDLARNKVGCSSLALFMPACLSEEFDVAMNNNSSLYLIN